MNNVTTSARPTDDAATPQAVKLDRLLKHPNVWRARQLSDQQSRTQAGIATGFSALDTHLPGEGWPRSGLVELLLTSAGIGELSLLIPALRTLTQDERRWSAWINPPFVPYAPALRQAGIDTGKLLLIQLPQTAQRSEDHKAALWALERACRSGSLSAALAWLDERQLTFKDTQRLQVAAKQGRTFACLVRPGHAHTAASMAELRLALGPAREPGHLHVDLLKRRGGWPLLGEQGLTLDVGAAKTRAAPLALREQLAQWRAQTHARHARAVAPELDTELHPTSRGLHTGQVAAARVPLH